MTASGRQGPHTTPVLLKNYYCSAKVISLKTAGRNFIKKNLERKNPQKIGLKIKV